MSAKENLNQEEDRSSKRWVRSVATYGGETEEFLREKSKRKQSGGVNASKVESRNKKTCKSVREWLLWMTGLAALGRWLLGKKRVP